MRRLTGTRYRHTGAAPPPPPHPAPCRRIQLRDPANARSDRAPCLVRGSIIDERLPRQQLLLLSPCRASVVETEPLLRTLAAPARRRLRAQDRYRRPATPFAAKG